MGDQTSQPRPIFTTTPVSASRKKKSHGVAPPPHRRAEEFDEQAQNISRGEPIDSRKLVAGPAKDFQHGVFHDVPEIGIEGTAGTYEGPVRLVSTKTNKPGGRGGTVERQPPEHGGRGVTSPRRPPSRGSDFMQDDSDISGTNATDKRFGDRKVIVEHITVPRRKRFCRALPRRNRFQRGFGVITAFAVKGERACR